MINFSSRNPCRPVDWRWKRACQVAATHHGRLRRSIDDDFVSEATKFRRQLVQCDNDEDHFKLSERMPGMYWAYVLYEATDAGQSVDEDEPRNEYLLGYRYELEARLLARDDPQSAAMHCCIPVEAVLAYEQAFFNVADRLYNTGYILHFVLGPALHRGLSEREYDLLWKWYGYTYGPYMLDSLISQSNAPHRPRRPDEVKAAWKDDGTGSVLRKQALAARTLPVNRFTSMDLLHVYAKFVEIEKNAEGGNSAGVEDSILASIEASLSLIPWRVNDNTVVDENSVQRYHESGGEVRPDEALLIAAGQAREVKDGLDDVPYPEPNHAETEQGS